MVWPSRQHQRLVLGQVKVADKSIEIVAIPKLLELLAIGAPSSPSTRSAASAPSPSRSSTRRPTRAGAQGQSGPCARMSNFRRRAESQGLQDIKSAGMVQPTDMRCSASDPLNGTRYRGILVPRRTPPRDRVSREALESSTRLEARRRARARDRLRDWRKRKVPEMDTALLNSSSLSRRYCVRRLSLSAGNWPHRCMCNLDEVTA